MKLKQQPEDFQVEELTDVVAGAEGHHALYRLTKRGWATPDALAAIRRRWKIDQRRLSYGGLKDRHALTVQYFSIFHGPRRKLTHHDVNVEYLGQLVKPYTSEDIRANRFCITLRELTADDIRRAEKALAEIKDDGLPNYFDDQRFGSRSGGDFFARQLILGQYEDALKLALTAPYEFDRATAKKEKAILRAHWSDWPACKEKLPRGHVRNLMNYLVHHPQDFRGAVERLRPDLRSLYLSAYQSHLWNRMLAKWLRDHVHPAKWLHVPLKVGALPLPRGLAEPQKRELNDLQLPLPSPRHQLPAGDPRLRYLETLLQEEGITFEQMKLKELTKMFFSRGSRPAWYFPSELNYNTTDDDRHPRRQKLFLQFDLPRGSYATLIVKRLTLEP